MSSLPRAMQRFVDSVVKRGRVGGESYREIWNDLAEHDALWAVLAFDEKRNRAWTVREFMQIGEREIALTLFHSEANGHRVHPGKALDFGCGVGRLTQALARRFDQAVGVDISDEMIRLANVLNRYPGRATYERVEGDGLSHCRSDDFDFVYSAIALQHIPTASALAYIREFGRVLKPGGVLVFQLPSHRADPATVETRPMTDAGYRAAVDLVGAIPTGLIAGESARLLLRITNMSAVDWIQKDLGSLRIGNHWLDHTGELMVMQDDGRSVMPMVVKAGASFDADLLVCAPSVPGAYILEVDLVHEAVTWFAGRGSPTARHEVTVSAGQTHGRSTPQVVELPVPEYPDVQRPSAEPRAAPHEFPMFGASKESVLEALRAGGLSLFHLEDDPRAGHDWVSYLYFATKPK